MMPGVALRISAVAATLTLAVVSCSGPLPLDDRQLGVVSGLDAVAPGFVVEASPVVREGRLVLEIRAALAPADLAFSRHEEGYLAPIPLWFRVRDRQGRETFAARETNDSLLVRTVEESRSDRKLVFTEVFDVPPGRLVAEVVLLDGRGDDRATRRFEVHMPDPAHGPVALPPRLMRGGDLVVGAHVRAWRLREDVRVRTSSHPGTAEAPVLSVTRARADTAVATPPFWINPPRGSLAYRGVAFDGEDVDTLMVVDQVDAELALPLLDEGVYSVSAWIDGDGDRMRRPIIVLPETHPRVETIDAMIDALAYIAYPAELAYMREAGSGFERRERFDAFWGSLFEVRQLAEGTLRLYFERVEEANRLFTSHKPGWMTDRGMVYIMHGTPEIVERSVDGEVWRFAYARGGTSESYFFERVPYAGAPWPLHHHVLQRSQRFESDWQRAIRRWRRGEVR